MIPTRARHVVLFASSIIALAGCPIYPDDRGQRVCVGGECFDCPTSRYTSSCVEWVCNTNLDCPATAYCGADGRCVFDGAGSVPAGGICTAPSQCEPGTNCGADGRCHAGDCSTSGCPTSYVCKLSGGVPRCELVGDDKDGGALPGPDAECRNDAQCTSPEGSRCLSGKCVAPADQCTDSTQCHAGHACVDGGCVPRCEAGKACPEGYACDSARGVCTENPKTCKTTSECGGGRVCSQEHCVAPCSPSGQCDAGLTCIEGGCVVEERPVFVCEQDGPSKACASGSLCLHHSCYIGCDSDAGADACKASDVFNECKSVSTASGSYSVCGSASNLGGECDPSLQKRCDAAKVCIDGFCR